MKRKKRLKKGIESLEEQIKIHEEKKTRAEQAGLLELVRYYDKELESKKEALKYKKKILDK